MKNIVYTIRIIADYLAIRYKEEYGEDISILKINKVLYFCFAYWGAYVKIGKNNINNIEVERIEEYKDYLFDAEFKAGAYGPYIVKLPTLNNKYNILDEEKNNFNVFIFRKQYSGEVFKFLDPLIRDLFEANEFDLMDISKKDEEYKRAKNNNYGIMNNENIIDEYCKKKF